MHSCTRTWTQNDDMAHMVLCRKLAELTVKVNLMLYQKYIIHDKKCHMGLYMETQKAVSSTLKVALLFYIKLVDDL